MEKSLITSIWERRETKNLSFINLPKCDNDMLTTYLSSDTVPLGAMFVNLESEKVGLGFGTNRDIMWFASEDYVNQIVDEKISEQNLDDLRLEVSQNTVDISNIEDDIQDHERRISKNTDDISDIYINKLPSKADNEHTHESKDITDLQAKLDELESKINKNDIPFGEVGWSGEVGFYRRVRSSTFSNGAYEFPIQESLQNDSIFVVDNITTQGGTSGKEISMWHYMSEDTGASGSYAFVGADIGSSIPVGTYKIKARRGRSGLTTGTGSNGIIIYFVIRIA